MLYHQRSHFYSHELKVSRAVLRNCCKPENYKRKFIFIYIYIYIYIFGTCKWRAILPINLFSRASQETSYMAQMWKEGGCGLKKLFCIASFMSQNLIQCNIRRGVLIQENHWKTGCKSRLPSWEKAPEHLFWRAWQGVVHTPLHSMLFATSHRCKGPKEQNGFLTEKKKNLTEQSSYQALLELF